MAATGSLTKIPFKVLKWHSGRFQALKISHPNQAKRQEFWDAVVVGCDIKIICFDRFFRQVQIPAEIISQLMEKDLDTDLNPLTLNYQNRKYYVIQLQLVAEVGNSSHIRDPHFIQGIAMVEFDAVSFD